MIVKNRVLTMKHFDIFTFALSKYLYISIVKYFEIIVVRCSKYFTYALVFFPRVYTQAMEYFT